MPDALYRKLKQEAASRNTTMRDLLVHAVESTLLQQDSSARFQLRNASAGPGGKNRRAVSSETINRAIDELRDPSFSS